MSRAQETPQKTQQRQQMNKTSMSQNRMAKKLKVETIDDAMNNFKTECKKQPVYICTSCHRLLWRKGVQNFSIEKYNKIRADIIQFVLDEKYRISSIDGSIIYVSAVTGHSNLVEFLHKVKQIEWH